MIGSNNVAVPTHFFKVVVTDDPKHGLEMSAFVLPNQKIPDETPLESFMVSKQTMVHWFVKLLVNKVVSAAAFLSFDHWS